MMARRLEPEIPIGMEKVYRRFERWRSSNGGRRLMIPESLWAAAVEAAREHGVFRTSKLLGLDYAKLKGMTQNLSTGGRSITKPPAFVELVTAESAGLCECTIELEGRRGKIRIQWKGITPPDLSGLSRALWELE